MTDWGPWSRIVVRHAAQAWGDQARVDREWRDLHFTARPDFAAASRQHGAFIEILRSAAPVHACEAAGGLTLDAIYVRDASIVTPGGAVLCRMGKAARQAGPCRGAFR
jgi:N-dimethylarginine dimethylaminohydrolase